jgi:hypothetical protein
MGGFAFRSSQSDLCPREVILSDAPINERHGLRHDAASARKPEQRGEDAFLQ